MRAAGCVYAEDEARLIVESARDDEQRLEVMVARRCAGEPLELVVGFAEFGGVRVLVEPGVFVPRQRTAGLVDIAVEVLAAAGHPGVVVDLGCGSGALLTALLHRAPCQGYAVDIEPAAVRCARRNLVGTGATVLQGDYFMALPTRLHNSVDVVLANLPYVPTDGIGLMPREARLYEPATALDGGLDGLDPLRTALGSLDAWLAPGGAYLCELNVSQLLEAERIAGAHGYELTASTDPEAPGALVRIGRRTARSA